MFVIGALAAIGAYTMGWLLRQLIGTVPAM
jgi:hypothetical protein